MSDSGELREVRYRRYEDALDLTGKDLFSLLDRSRDDVRRLAPSLGAESQLTRMRLPVQQLTAPDTGEIADEVHEWPRATLGRTLRHLVMYFVDGRLASFSWKFPPPPAKRSQRRWYERLFGKR